MVRSLGTVLGARSGLLIEARGTLLAPPVVVLIFMVLAVPVVVLLFAYVLGCWGSCLAERWRDKRGHKITDKLLQMRLSNVF